MSLKEKDKILDELGELAEMDKFSYEKWYDRGLNPSDDDVIKYMNDRLNLCLAEIILEISKDTIKEKYIRRTLITGLRRIRRIDLDTEEAEFIADYFDLISKIIGFKIANEIMKWLYGPFVFYLLKIGGFFKRKDKILYQKQQPCSKCGNAIVLAVKKEGGENTGNWIIGKCTNCHEYNLIESFPNSKSVTFTDFYPEEYLSKQEYSLENAKQRLEQIKYWRK